MDLVYQYRVWLRFVLTGVLFAFWVIQYEPSGSLRSQRIVTERVGFASYQAIYIITETDKYAVLFADDKVRSFLRSLKKGDVLNAVVRQDNGIVEAHFNGEKIYGQESYRRAKDVDKKIGQQGMSITFLLLLLTFLIKSRAPNERKAN
ncbi:hypothetical protein ACX0MV_07005 [Pseudomonas borbori]